MIVPTDTNICCSEELAYISKISNKPGTVVGELIDIVTDADERTLVDGNREKIVIIDPSPIGTTEFSLRIETKRFLLKAGRLAGLEFLHKYNVESSVMKQEVDALREEVSRERLRFKSWWAGS